MDATFNPFTLKGKTIIVTGASSGIGRQCAIDCSRAGANIILVARNEERLKETLTNLAEGNHMIVLQDINCLPTDFIEKIASETGPINGFIHCAGCEKTLPLKFLKAENYSEVIQTNALSAFEIIRQLTQKKNLADRASLILISSISALIARIGLTAYAASKGAVNSAVRVMALELSKRNIRVNTISPGTILTPMMEKALEALSEEQRLKRTEGFPLGLGIPEDISYACIYLLSDASRWVTGQNLIVDGGYTAR